MDVLYNQLVEHISRRTNQNPVPIVMGKFEGIGWLSMPYTSNTYNGDYPTVVIKQYDKTVNLYVTVFENNEPIIERYKDIFGKNAIGKSCIRIRKMDDARLEALDEILAIAIQQYEAQEKPSE